MQNRTPPTPASPTPSPTPPRRPRRLPTIHLEIKGNKMLVLVSYDVSTTNKIGQTRLTRIAKICQDYGQRVQNSVFECVVDPAQWTTMRARLLKTYKENEDSHALLPRQKLAKQVEHQVPKTPQTSKTPLIV